MGSDSESQNVLETAAEEPKVAPTEDPEERILFYVGDFTIEVVSGKFRPEGRDIEIGEKDGYAKNTEIDGRIAWGAGSLLPFTELRKFRIRRNGKDIWFPEKVWGNCFEPHLESYVFYENDFDLIPVLRSWVEVDDSRLLLELGGSDAGSGYFARWEIVPGKFVKQEIFSEDVKLEETMYHEPQDRN